MRLRLFPERDRFLECAKSGNVIPVCLEILADTETPVSVLDKLRRNTENGPLFLLESVVEEHLLLSLPMQPLCSEDCKGLCTGCGANRNHQDCACPEGAGRSPFDCLKEFVVKER